jgi:hypothetical protein
MEPRAQKKTRATQTFSFHLKCSVVLFLLIISLAVEACSSASSNTGTTITNLGAPPVTVTIQFDHNLTALPTQPPYLCGAWLTNTSPNFIPGSIIPVYAKFVHLVNGNPQGVANATAIATLHLANGTLPTTLTATTTGTDGLAIFSFTLPNDPNIANRNNLVSVSFTGPDGSTCVVDKGKEAYFTPMMVTPKAVATATPATTPATTPAAAPPMPATPATPDPANKN